MGPFDGLHELLLEFVAWRSGIGVLFESNGVGWLWRLLHYLTDAKTWMLCLLPVLVLQRLLPAREVGPGYWRSFLVDWLYPVFSIAIASHLVVPVVGYVYFLGREAWPEGPGHFVGQWPGFAQYLLAFVVQDLLRYVSHVLRHKIRFLWHFHAVHHSQVNLNPATTYRTHPFEAFVGALLFALPIGIIGIDPVPWIYAGVTSLFWDFFIHSNMRTNLGFVGRFVVSPQFHRVHHSSSPEHVDRNFGERLVLWDWLFGTAARDRDVYPPTGCPESAVLMMAPSGLLWPVKCWLCHFLFPFRVLLRRHGVLRL